MPVVQEAADASTPTPIPYFRVVLLGLILAANNTSIWMIFSFLPFMVKHFFPSLSMTELGYEAGLLGSAFSAGSLIGNVLWGVVSDRAGRRPTLLCGLLGTSLSALAFGFAPTFYTAVFARFMWGLLNGNLGVAKTYLTEISDDSNAARGMAIFVAIGGVGRTIGPVIGGFLSSPADKYPATFEGTFFETYPYALASLVVSVNCMLVFLLSYFYITETLPVGSAAATASGTGGAVTYSPLRTYEDLDSPKSSTHGIELAEVKEGNESSPVDSTSAMAAEPKKRVMFSGIVEVSVIGSGKLAYSSLKNISPHDQPVISETVAMEDVEGGPRPYLHRIVQYSNGADEDMGLQQRSLWGTMKSIFSQEDVVLSTLLYGLNALAIMVYNEVFPLWVVTPIKSGGFELDSNTIGIIITVCGGLSILLQTTLYPMLAERLGVLRMYKVGVLLLICGAILTPAVSTFNVLHSKPAVIVALVCSQLLQLVASNWSFISLFVLINNASYRAQRATVNGLGQTFASLGRLVGPYSGATLFAWSEGNGQAWPLNYHLVFYAMALVNCISFYVCGLLPRTIERRKREPRSLAQDAPR